MDAEKQKDIVFLKKYCEIIDIACAEQYLCKRDLEHNTKRKTHRVLTKSKKRKENTLWRTGNGVSATRILNCELRVFRKKTYFCTHKHN